MADDNGGSSSDALTIDIGTAGAVWANSQTAARSLSWTGGGGSIEGLVHTNHQLWVRGQAKSVTGPSEFVSSTDINGNGHSFTPTPVQVPVADYPLRFNLADYRPGGAVALQVGTAYQNRTSSCANNGTWHLTNEVLPSGVYYVNCSVHLNGSNIGGRVTLVAEGTFKVNGSRPAFEPYYDGLLFLSGSTANKAIDISASNSKFLGFLFSELGQIDVSGSDNRFFCGLLTDRISLTGGGLWIRGGSCGRPTSTVATPVLAPTLQLGLQADHATALPGETVQFDLVASNSGALLLAPGVIGLENVDTSATTVRSYAYLLEYFSIPTQTWLPLASASGVASGYTPVEPIPTIGGVSLSIRPNPFVGVTYPSSGDPVLNTVLNANGFATWGYQALVSLTPAQVNLLLDPALVGGLRNQVVVELSPASVQVRHLFRYGTDFVAQLRGLTGDIHNAEITFVPPTGDLHVIILSSGIDDKILSGKPQAKFYHLCQPQVYYTYDAVGRTIEVLDPANGVTRTTYDKVGRVVASSNRANQTTTITYDAAGNRIGVADPLGRTTTYVYDAANRLTSMSDPLGHSATYVYDDAGPMTKNISAAGVETTFGYDVRDLPTTVRDELGNTTTTTYDDAGQRTAETDARGATTRFGYDAVGRMTVITDAIGSTVHMGYDLAGQQTSMTNALGHTWSTTYHPLGGGATARDPLNRVKSWSYDLAGRLVAQTDARNTTVNYNYDAANQLLSVSTPGETISYAYDVLGRRQQMIDNTGITAWVYDTADRVSSVTSAQGVISYGHDAAGQRTSMTQPAGAINYSYDVAGRLTSMNDWLNATTTFGYDPDGQVTAINRANGVNTTHGYDAAGRLSSILHRNGATQIDSFVYSLDGNGNRTSVMSGAGTETYTINSLNQVTAVSYPGGGTQSFTYDAAGNRLSETDNGFTTSYTYDAAGQLTSAGSVAYTYDSAGNRLTAGNDSYVWDWKGRLAQSVIGGATSSYAYDGDDVRIAMSAGGVPKTYLWDRQAELPLLISDGTTKFLHADDQLLSEANSNATHYPLADALGSVRNLVDGAGGRVGSASYEVFGAPRSQSGASSSFGFTGQQQDSTGLLYLRARYLDPVNGGFLSVDPVRPSAPKMVGYNRL